MTPLEARLTLLRGTPLEARLTLLRGTPFEARLAIGTEASVEALWTIVSEVAATTIIEAAFVRGSRLVRPQHKLDVVGNV